MRSVATDSICRFEEMTTALWPVRGRSGGAYKSGVLEEGKDWYKA
jgi:hypothetical protein